MMTDERSLKLVPLFAVGDGTGCGAHDMMTDERSLKPAVRSASGISGEWGARHDDRREVIETVVLFLAKLLLLQAHDMMTDERSLKQILVGFEPTTPR